MTCTNQDAKTRPASAGRVVNGIEEVVRDEIGTVVVGTVVVCTVVTVVVVVTWPGHRKI